MARQPANALVRAEKLSNLGDEMLLWQAIEGLRRSAGVGAFAVRLWNVGPAEAVRTIEEAGCKIVRGKSLAGIHPAQDMMVFGGGQVVRDNVSIAMLVALLFACVSLRVRGRPVIAVGIGISSLKPSLRRILWKLVLCCCNRVTVRDDASLAYARSLGIAAEKSADLAFLESEQLAGLAHTAQAQGAGLDRIILAACRDANEGRTIDKDFLATLIGSIDPDGAIPIMLVVHDPALDSLPAEELAAQLRGALANPVTIESPTSTGDLLALYERSGALVVSNRLHSIIFGCISGARLLVLDDGNPKLRAICGELAATFVSPDLIDDDIARLVNGELAGEHDSARTAAMAAMRTRIEHEFRNLRSFI